MNSNEIKGATPVVVENIAKQNKTKLLDGINAWLRPPGSDHARIKDLQFLTVGQVKARIKEAQTSRLSETRSGTRKFPMINEDYKTRRDRTTSESKEEKGVRLDSYKRDEDYKNANELLSLLLMYANDNDQPIYQLKERIEAELKF